MASTVTVTELTTRVRRATDTENATARFPDAEIQDYLKTAHRQWWDFLINNGGGHLLEASSPHTVSTVADTATVALATDHYRLVGVDADVGGDTRTLFPLPSGERNRYSEDGLSWQGMRKVYYRVVGSNLTLYPTPDAVYSLTVHYIPEAEVDFGTGSNTVDGYNGWDEYIVYVASLKLLNKDNRRTEHIDKDLSALKRDVRLSLRNLDDGNPPQVTDTHGLEHDLFGIY